jgi:hypothetical protein
MVLYACNTWQVEQEDHQFKASPDKRPCLKKQMCAMAHIYNPSYVRGRGRRIMVWGQPWAKGPKNKIKAKRVGGVVQGVEHLPKNPSTAKKKLKW